MVPTYIQTYLPTYMAYNFCELGLRGGVELLSRSRDVKF